MSKKYFVILGLFLVAGFLFLNTNLVLAADKYWTGNATASSTYGGRDFWNPSNWDTAVPASGDNIWLFATSSPNNTIVISTPVSLGAGKIYVGYNQKGNTLGNSSAPVTLLIREGASLTNTGIFEVGTSSTVLLTSGSLSVGTTTIKQAASTTIDSVTGATSTVTIAGDFTLGSAAQYTSPSNSTTTLNLPSGTSGTTTFYAATSTPTFGYLAFGGTGTTNLQISSLTVANRLNIAAGRTLAAGGGTITLSGSDSNSMTFPLEVSGTFTAATSTVTWTGTSATTVASTTYATVNFNGATTYTLGGNSTVTTAATVASGATLAISTFTFTATGSTWTNNGTVTEGTGGKIVLASASRFDNGSGTAKSSFSADNNGSVSLQVTDTSLNLLSGTIETLTGTITAISGISSGAQTVTLTETGASTGIFRGGLTFTLSGTAVTGALAYQGGGTLNYSWTDKQDSSDTGSCTGCATFTGSNAGGGSGGGVSYAAPATTDTTTSTQVATTSTPAAVVQPTPSVAVAPAAPTLESIQSKIASVVTQVAALTKSSSAADIAAVQAQISSILNDIQSLQTAQPTPQGVALGFHFVRPLALGMSNSDISNLQKALKTDSSVYPEGTVSGYFGPLTLKAVKKFQEKYGISSSGGVGYGVVGPKTRAKLNELYGNK